MTSFLMSKNPPNSNNNNISAATKTAAQKQSNYGCRSCSSFDSVIKKSLDSTEESPKTNVEGGNDKKCSRRQRYVL